MLGVAYGRTIALACALVALTYHPMSVAQTAPRAAALGPEVVMAEPSGGFVGQLRVAPENGPVGTPLTVTARASRPSRLRSGLAYGEGAVEGHVARIFRPRVYPVAYGSRP